MQIKRRGMEIVQMDICCNCWATSECSVVFLALRFFVSFSRQDVQDACMHAEGSGLELRVLCDFLLTWTDILLGKHRIKHDKEMLFINNL